MSKVDDALDCFDEGYVCSQAVLTAFSGLYGLERKRALKLAAAFGGGLACTAQLCGSVSGALMVIGLVHGRIDVEDNAAKEKTYRLSQRLMAAVENRFGSIVCKSILGVDISTEEGLAQAREADLFGTTCRECIAFTVKTLEENL